ncbi:MAG: tetratricopeptide repeat protein [Bacteroidales bacterium]
MSTGRIEDLKRRIQRDPASIAFAQLGEEYRRAGRYREAVETCRAGLARHPGYLSARVTLGRALAQLRQLEEAARELQQVLAVAPDNLAALRALADIARDRGDRATALLYFERAALLASQDTDLQQAVGALRAEGPRHTATPAVPALSHTTAPASSHGTASTRPQRVLAALERWHAAIVAYKATRRS